MTPQSRAFVVGGVAAISAAGAAVANTIVYSPNLASGNYTLVPNGGFESPDMAGWSSPYGNGNFVASTNSIIGAYAAVTNTLADGVDAGYATQQVLGLTPGATYVLSAFFRRGTLADGNLYVDLDDIAGDPNMAMNIGDARTQFVYATFTAPDDGMVTVRLVRDGTRVAGESGYIDNVAITAASDFRAAVVPLPPAALAGLGSLAGVAGIGLIRRRRLTRV